MSLKYDLTKGVGLYDLRYVRVGKDLVVVQALRVEEGASG